MGELNIKKVAVIACPYSSLQEITTLTSCLKIWFDKDIDYLGSEMEELKDENKD